MLLETLLPRNREFYLWDAVVQWRDKIVSKDFYNTTKSNYLSGMLKLIEAGILDSALPLNEVTEEWFESTTQRIDCNPSWKTATKTMRKSCLSSFYRFVTEEFDRTIEPYQRHPEQNEIKHMLSHVRDQTLVKDISPVDLCEAMSKINMRDAYIVWLMMHTGETLETILAVLKTREEYEPPYIRFAGKGKYIPKHITNALDEISKNSKVYLFETKSGKKIRRNQVIRNLKKAGHAMGLEFDLTPKLLHGYVCGYMCRDRRSEIEKALCV